MKNKTMISVRIDYFLEQVKRLGTREACQRYSLRDPKTLRKLTEQEKVKLAGIHYE